MWFVPSLHYVCTYFVLCLCYVLMSFDVKMGKMAKEGNRQQALGTSGEKSEVRGRRSEVRGQRSEDRGRTTWGGRRGGEG